ncbi:MAG: TIR domain-containing protein [Sphingomicrobium sp.]
MADVFISYKAEDRRRVRPLVDALEADGIAVWWDARIGGAEAWRETIETELNAAKCVIVIWSAQSVGPQGSFVRDEASRAVEQGTYLPVKIDECRQPLGFGETQALPLVGWKGKRSDPRYQNVLGTVRAIVDRAPPPRSALERGGPPVSRRTLIAGGAIAGVVVAGAGGWAWIRSRSNSANRSIAVLPFENLSGDPSQAYFSDGIAEELRDDLSQIAGLRVVARTSCEAVRNDVATVAEKKLGVSSILTGSVRRSPQQIRISTQLVDGSDGLERWSQTYDRAPGDFLAIQTEIAREVANALELELGADTRLTLGGTRNPQAQDLLLKAMAAGGRDTPEGMQSAIDLLDAAIALDPNYAQAFAQNALFTLWYNAVFTTDAETLRKSAAKALGYANRAIAIAPRYSLGYVALATYYSTRLQLRQALTEYERATSLPGVSVDDLLNYAAALLYFGRFRDRDAIFDRARALDPLNTDLLSEQVRGLYLEGRFNEAADAAAVGLRRLPNNRDLITFLAYAQLMLGHTDAAIARFKGLDSSDWHQLDGLALAAARSGNREDATSLLQQFEKQHPSGSFYQFAEIHAQLGAADAAFAALDDAFAETDPGLQITKVDPFLQPLHGDRRFGAFLGKLGLA